jgi:hypothetical protein
LSGSRAGTGSLNGDPLSISLRGAQPLPPGLISAVGAMSATLTNAEIKLAIVNTALLSMARRFPSGSISTGENWPPCAPPRLYNNRSCRGAGRACRRAGDGKTVLPRAQGLLRCRTRISAMESMKAIGVPDRQNDGGHVRPAARWIAMWPGRFIGAPGCPGST